MTDAPGQPVGLLSQLYRFPVKSLGGETLGSAQVNRRGLEGDRLWAVENKAGKFGSGKTTRRFRRMDGLLEFSARYEDVRAPPMLRLSDGREVPGTSETASAALSTQTGQAVRLTREADISHFDEGALHLLTTSALDTLMRVHSASPDAAPLDPLRFRPNLLLDTGPLQGHIEAGWGGRRMRIGSALVIEIVRPMPRCLMLNLAQPGLAADEGVLRSVLRLEPSGCYGVLAQVLEPGLVRLGDAARLL